MKKGTIILLGILLIVNPLLLSCQQELVKATTTIDNSGIAVVNMGGHNMIINAVDHDSVIGTFSRINVSIAEQQGKGMVYAEDPDRNYFPQLVFLNSTLKETDAVSLPLYGVGDSEVATSEPVEVDIDPDRLHKIGDCRYTQLGSFLEKSYPDVNSVVFLYSEEIKDIELCSVTLYTAPFPEVVYAYLQGGAESSGFNLVNTVYAAPLEQTVFPEGECDIRTRMAAILVLIIASPIDDIAYISIGAWLFGGGEKDTKPKVTFYKRTRNGDWVVDREGEVPEDVPKLPSLDINLDDSAQKKDTTGQGDASGSTGSGSGGGCSDGH